MKVLGVVGPVLGRVVDLRPPPLDRQRALMSRVERRLKVPADVTVTDTVVAGVPVLKLTSGSGDRGVLLHVHGGAYVVGSRHAGRALGAVVSNGGPDLWSVDYRLAPEHPFPAGLDDTVAVYTELLTTVPAEKVVVIGESAGGGLVLALVQHLRDQGLPLPAAAIPVFPWADLEQKGETMTTNRNKDSLTVKSLSHAASQYAGGRPLTDPGLSPINGSFDGFPPTYIPVGTRDMLLSDARLVTDKLRAAGVDVTLREWPGCVHGFTALGAPESRAAVDEIRSFVDRVLA